MMFLEFLCIKVAIGECWPDVLVLAIDNFFEL